jgi:hypothetical protein
MLVNTTYACMRMPWSKQARHFAHAHLHPLASKLTRPHPTYTRMLVCGSLCKHTRTHLAIARRGSAKGHRLLDSSFRLCPCCSGMEYLVKGLHEREERTWMASIGEAGCWNDHLPLVSVCPSLAFSRHRQTTPFPPTNHLPHHQLPPPRPLRHYRSSKR